MAFVPDRTNQTFFISLLCTSRSRKRRIKRQGLVPYLFVCMRSAMLNQSGHFAKPFPTVFAFERLITSMSLKMPHQFLSLIEQLPMIV
jgi:hypothetical protein